MHENLKKQKNISNLQHIYTEWRLYLDIKMPRIMRRYPKKKEESMLTLLTIFATLGLAIAFIFGL